MSGFIKTVLNVIAGFFADLGNTFWNFYIATSGDLLFGWTASWWRTIGGFFDELSFSFILFRDWCMNVADAIATFLDSWDILDLLAIPIQWASDAWAWIESAWSNVWQIVNAWWLTVESTVQGWIDVAQQFVLDLLAGVQVGLDLVMTAWDNFWTTTLPTLVDAFTVEGLIDSALRSWFPFYDLLAGLIDVIGEFFTDPFDWLFSRLESWFWES